MLGQTLISGTAIDRLVSPNGRYTLLLQRDGNLVLYDPTGVATWAASWDAVHWAFGDPAMFHRLCLQSRDGHLVIYNSKGFATWWSNTNSVPPAVSSLSLANNGRLTLEDKDGNVLWSKPN